MHMLATWWCDLIAKILLHNLFKQNCCLHCSSRIISSFMRQTYGCIIIKCMASRLRSLARPHSNSQARAMVVAKQNGKCICVPSATPHIYNICAQAQYGCGFICIISTRANQHTRRKCFIKNHPFSDFLLPRDCGARRRRTGCVLKGKETFFIWKWVLLLYHIRLPSIQSIFL